MRPKIVWNKSILLEKSASLADNVRVNVHFIILKKELDGEVWRHGFYGQKTFRLTPYLGPFDFSFSGSGAPTFVFLFTKLGVFKYKSRREKGALFLLTRLSLRKGYKKFTVVTVKEFISRDLLFKNVTILEPSVFPYMQFSQKEKQKA